MKVPIKRLSRTFYSEHGFDYLVTALRRIPPSAYNALGDEIGVFHLHGGVAAVNNNQLYLHFFGVYRFYVYACSLTGSDVSVRLCKTGKVWGKLNEYAVAFNASDDSANRLAGGKHGGVFLPCAQKFLVAYIEFLSVEALVNHLYSVAD